MAFIPVPRGIQLCFLFLTGGQHWQFCLTLQKSSGEVDHGDLVAVTSAADGWWDAGFNAVLSAANYLSSIVATDISEQGGEALVHTMGESSVGPAGILPNNVAAVISQRTAKRGRSYRGRAYVGGLTNADQVTSTQMGSAAAAELVDQFVDLQEALDAAGYDVVVASRQHNGVTTNPADVNEVTAFVVDTLYDSQRRRLEGRGT